MACFLFFFSVMTVRYLLTDWPETLAVCTGALAKFKIGLWNFFFFGLLTNLSQIA